MLTYLCLPVSTCVCLCLYVTSIACVIHCVECIDENPSSYNHPRPILVIV
eukprot:COSAG03_NODE_182_length_10965_cov_19.659520_5_plen_50_part_00